MVELHFQTREIKMILKPLIATTLTCLSVMSFSANAAPVVLANTTMTLNTEVNSSLLIDSPPSGIPVSQVGQMTGSHLGLDWVLDYTNPLDYILSNNNGVYSQGTYTDFVITGYTTTGSNSGTSTSTGSFTDSTLGGVIIDVTSEGTWSGAFDQSIYWEGTGTFNFRSNAPSAVPLPATAFLFAPALLGFMSLRRKAKNSVA
jgi:hypothetical protein